MQNYQTKLKPISLVVTALFSLMSTSALAANNKFAYIGTYSGNGQGVYLVNVDPNSGALSKVKLVSDLPNAAQLTLDKNNKTLFVASEVSNYNQGKNGSVASYQIDPKTGDLRLLSQVDSQGAGAVYVAVHPAGQYLLVANYFAGSIATLPIDQHGRLSEALFIFQSKGEPGAPYPVAAVQGSFAVSDHDGPHAHAFDTDPSGKFAFSTDLGLDRIYQWKFDAKTGALTANNPAYIMASSKGAGPRHFVFHPKGDFVYLINEESSTLTAYAFDKQAGTLTEKQSISTLPKNYKGTNYASGIVISADGRFIYAANRLHNTIARIAVDKQGNMQLVDEVWTRGDYPRTITIDPSGRYMYALNQRSDNVTQFKIDNKTGALTFIDGYTDVGSPSQMVFLNY